VEIIYCQYKKYGGVNCTNPAEILVSTDKSFYICREHDHFCWVCGQQATHACEFEGPIVCNTPTCDSPEHDHSVFHRGWIDPKQGLDIGQISHALVCKTCSFWTGEVENYEDICPRCHVRMERVGGKEFLKSGLV
jgi:hypothetical protein